MTITFKEKAEDIKEKVLWLMLENYKSRIEQKALEAVSAFRIGKEYVEVELSQEITKSMEDLMGKESINSQVVELLLWIAVLLPEI